MSVLAEVRRLRADRVRLRRGPFWWLRHAGEPTWGKWAGDRLVDVKVWLTQVLVCGTAGHRWGMSLPELEEIGWRTMFSCDRCGSVE